MGNQAGSFLPDAQEDAAAPRDYFVERTNATAGAQTSAPLAQDQVTSAPVINSADHSVRVKSTDASGNSQVATVATHNGNAVSTKPVEANAALIKPLSEHERHLLEHRRLLGEHGRLLSDHGRLLRVSA
jgi:hypothetical protein